MSDYVENLFSDLQKQVDDFSPEIERKDVGTTVEAGDGIARVSGLADVSAQELVQFENAPNPGGGTASGNATVKANLQQAFHDVMGVAPHAKMIQLELTSKRRLLAKAGHPIKAELRGKLAPRPPVPDETYNYWKFAQEYWEDELGYYEYTVRRACPKAPK